METDLLFYFVIVDIENLCYIDCNGNFATIDNAIKFYDIKEAESFLWTLERELRTKSIIYKVHTHITLSLEKYGKDIADPNVLIKHNISKDLTSGNFIVE